MHVPTISAIPRAIVAFTAMWLMFSHQPDAGTTRPGTIASVIAQTQTDSCAPSRSTTCDGQVFDAMRDSISDMEQTRSNVIVAISRVRADLNANGLRASKREAHR